MKKRAKIIDFSEVSEYDRILAETIKYLDEQLMIIPDLFVGLAVKGKWKTWDENLEVGAIFDFTEEMLRDTGDDNVNCLIELYVNIRNVKIDLEQRNIRAAKIAQKEMDEDLE